jgi:NitT/TauT family transport system substrate-binding protein
VKRLALLLALMPAFFAAPAAAQTLTSIQVAAFPIDLNGPLYYALDLGYFKKAGLDVNIQTFSNVQEGAAAMISGAVNIGTANVATIASAHLRGIDFRFFAPSGIFSDAAPPTEVVAVPKGSPLKTAADLNGKTVAVAGIKSMLQVATMGWGDKRGGDGKSYKFVEIPFPQMDAALAAHRVDAIVLTEPFATAAKDDTTTIGSPEEGVAPTFMTIGFFATSTWLQANPDTAKRFIGAIRDAAVWANAHHAESALILTKYSKMTPAVANSMARAVYGVTLDPKLIQAPIDVAARYGIIDHAFPATDITWVPGK